MPDNYLLDYLFSISVLFFLIAFFGVVKTFFDKQCRNRRLAHRLGGSIFLLSFLTTYSLIKTAYSAAIIFFISILLVLLAMYLSERNRKLFLKSLYG